MRIKAINKSYDTRCIDCSAEATWIIYLGDSGVKWSLCNSCCDQLSKTAGDAGNIHDFMDKLMIMLNEWKHR